MCRLVVVWKDGSIACVDSREYAGMGPTERRSAIIAALTKLWHEAREAYPGISCYWPFAEVSMRGLQLRRMVQGGTPLVACGRVLLLLPGGILSAIPCVLVKLPSLRDHPEAGCYAFPADKHVQGKDEHDTIVAPKSRWDVGAWGGSRLMLR